jgi:hypothetical protein
MTPTTRRFPASGPDAGELDFLLELGGLGGCLTGCSIEDSTVTYTGLRPG